MANMFAPLSVLQTSRWRLALALLFVLGATESWAGTLYQTNPRHAERSARAGLTGFAVPPGPPPNANVLAWFNGHPHHTVLTDKRLTAACQSKQFNQRIPQFYKAIFFHTGNISQVLGWARSGSPNLHDPQGLAKDGINYYFENDRSRKCRVYFLPD